ncbi:unnamed protein product [Jaminaea pallidilutea]
MEARKPFGKLLARASDSHCFGPARYINRLSRITSADSGRRALDSRWSESNKMRRSISGGRATAALDDN